MTDNTLSVPAPGTYYVTVGADTLTFTQADVDDAAILGKRAERERIAKAVLELDIEFEAGEGMVIRSEVLSIIEGKDAR